MGLRYETNGASFDFPEYIGFPTIRYVIASSPRCGSNFLQRSMWRTKIAGAPEEYLTEPYFNDFALRWDISDRGNNLDANKYLQMLMRFRTSPNGVFGIKIHGGHLLNPLLRNIDIVELLKDPIFILLRRRNKYLQAVSYSLARQTGVWILDGEWLIDKKTVISSPLYSLDELVHCLSEIFYEEDTWDDFFLRHGIKPFTVFYEDLENSFDEEMAKVFHRIGASTKNGFKFESGIKKQGTSQNIEWAERLKRDLMSTNQLFTRMQT
jgi:LPS sulfotransferase NodH